MPIVKVSLLTIRQGEQMDPDFMKRDSADRPFGHAPEQPLMRWIATVLVLLALVYAGYRVWEFSRDRASQPKTKQVAPVTRQPAPQPQESAQQQPPAAATPAPGTRIVTKCVVNGKTLYSDNACPQGVIGKQVVTKTDHNLMTSLTAAQIAASDRIQPIAPSISAAAPTGGSPSSNATECKALDDHIKYLDAMARQPQSGQMQDWIKDQRKRDRDRQFALHC